MKHGKPIFDNCTLLQACEWIAFKVPPMEKIRYEAHEFKRGVLLPEKKTDFTYDLLIRHDPSITQDDKDYSEKIYTAMAKLRLAIYDEKVKVYGDVTVPKFERQPLDLTTGLPESPDIEIPQEPRHVQITDVPNTVKLNLHENTLESDGMTYRHVYIPFNELRRAFNGANTVFETIETRYSTPYMEIMVEVISELNITATNQPSKKVLQDAVMHKMVERGLVGADGKPSTTLASYIATIIRMPESQRGHALTAPDSRSA